MNVNISVSIMTLFGKLSTNRESTSSGSMNPPCDSGLNVIEFGKIFFKFPSISLFKESATITILSSLDKFFFKYSIILFLKNLLGVTA